MSNFDDVGQFHEKFGLERVPRRGIDQDEPVSPHHISDELRDFRLKFLKEELDELAAGYLQRDLAQIADALVDLVYVAMGTAHLHGLPWEALWREVQRANMAKERCRLDHKFVPDPLSGPGIHPDRCFHPTHEGVCDQAEVRHSRRGSESDVIKPRGWTPPNIAGVLRCADLRRAEVHFIDSEGSEICACGFEQYNNGAHKGENK